MLLTGTGLPVPGRAALTLTPFGTTNLVIMGGYSKHAKAAGLSEFCADAWCLQLAPELTRLQSPAKGIAPTRSAWLIIPQAIHLSPEVPS